MTVNPADKTFTQNKALAVRLGEDLHAIPIASIEEILPALPIEWVPQCPVFVRGVISVRGHLIPVLDTATRLGLTDHKRPDEPYIVCVRVGERLVGLEVDEPLDLMELRDGTPVAAEELGAERGFFAGALDYKGKILRVLDPARLVWDDQTFQTE